MNIGMIVGFIGVVTGLVRPLIQIAKLLYRKDNKYVHPKELSVWAFGVLVFQLATLLFSNAYSHNLVMTIHFSIQMALSLAVTVILLVRGVRW
jgi:uncharacterized protein with PQ loop repeat